jgi:hypothetical protein
MLSNEEKKEMLEDAKSLSRRDSFRVSKNSNAHDAISLDGYLSYLNAIQKIFGQFTISKHPTITKINKL